LVGKAAGKPVAFFILYRRRKMHGMWSVVERFDRGDGDAYDFTRWLYGEPIHWYTAIAAGWMYLEHCGKKLSFEEFRKLALDVLRHDGYTPSDTLWKEVEQLVPKQFMGCDEREEDK
jgi:hypothetical protein